MQIVLVNLTILVLAGFLLFQRMSVELVTIVVLVSLMGANGALWIGWQVRQARLRRGKTPVKPAFLFGAGILSLAVAIISVVDGDYASAGFGTIGAICMVGLGFIVMKNEKRKSQP